MTIRPTTDPSTNAEPGRAIERSDAAGPPRLARVGGPVGTGSGDAATRARISTPRVRAAFAERRTVVAGAPRRAA